MSEERGTGALQKTKMSTLGVVALIYSFVCAGAFGIEEAISASGPGLTLAMLIIFPLIWSFPLCEMVGELGSILPTEGGVYAWGRAAFGEFWGWQVGWWSGLTTWICQAQYTALIAGYAAKIIALDPTQEFMIKVAVVVIFTIVNLIGLTSLERLETVLNILVFAAFAIVTIVGFMNWNYNPVTPFYNPDEGMFSSIGGGIAIIIWMSADNSKGHEDIPAAGCPYLHTSYPCGAGGHRSVELLVHGSDRRICGICRCPYTVCRRMGRYAVRYHRYHFQHGHVLLIHSPRLKSILRNGG